MQAQLVPVAALSRGAPRRTAMMQQRAREAARDGRRYAVDVRWVPYERVSPLLRRAILVAEDDAFYAHGGLDWSEIRESARRNLERGRIVRGGSTITQQLARNLFLGDSRTLTRKLTEAFLAVRLERALSKRRIFELYLNLIEWGDGIYGAEAAAQRYFGVPASNLGVRQAILLSAVIINPRRYSVLSPARRIERRVKLIAGRLRRRGFLDEGQYAEALGLPPVAEEHLAAGDSVGAADSAGLAAGEPAGAAGAPGTDAAGPHATVDTIATPAAPRADTGAVVPTP